MSLPTPTPEVARLAEIIGAEAALALIEARGGTRLYVPQNPHAGELVEILGPEAAAKLSDAYGRDRIKIPVGRTWRVLVYRARRMSYQQIARRAGCSEGQVWAILDRHQVTAKQFELFD